MLQRRVKAVWRVLNCSHTDIANIAGCSTAHISKIYTGKVTLAPTGRAVLRIGEALLKYAEMNNKTEHICAMLRCDNASLTAALLLDWMYGNYGDDEDFALDISDEASGERIDGFAERFSALLDVFGMNSVWWGRLLNVDASLISRFRTGKRLPKENSQIVDMFCSAVAERMHEQNCIMEISRLTGIKISYLLTPTAVELLKAWLFHGKRIKKTKPNTADYLRMFLPLRDLPAQQTMKFLQNKANENAADTYWGNQGIRQAVLRLLVEAAAEGGGEVYLYADQSMRWLFENEDDLQNWYLCCSLCFQCNVRMVVVHDINRNAREMASVMQMWLPLNMTGMVTPYYCPLSRGSRFTHTLFLRPGMAAVSSVQVLGASDNNYYDYICDARKINTLRNEFHLLISNSEKLLSVYTYENIEKYRKVLLPEMDESEKSIALLDAPSLVSMPDSVFDSMLARCSWTEDEKRELSVVRAKARLHMEEGQVVELFALPNIATVKKGKQFLSFNCTLHEDNPCYTVSEFQEHIREIIHLCRTHHNYICCLVEESLLCNMRMVVFKNLATIIRPYNPYTAFVIQNPFYAKALSVMLREYYDRRQCSREETIARLEVYLEI